MEDISWMDISDDIELRNGKANPFGWSQSEIFYKDESIGWLYCGEPTDFKDGYKYEVKNLGKEIKQCLIYKRIR